MDEESIGKIVRESDKFKGPIRRSSDKFKFGVDSVTLGKKKARAYKKSQTSSLFKSILSSHIEEESKTRIMAKNYMKDILVVFGLSESWQDVNPFSPVKTSYPQKISKKEEKKVSVELNYKPICNIFSRLSLQFNMQPEIELYVDRSFSDEFVHTVVLAIEHTYSLIINKLGLMLALNQNEPYCLEIGDHLEALKSFNNFFFITAKLKCNIILSEKHVNILQEALKQPFMFLQQKVATSFNLISDSPNQVGQRRIIATYLYYVLQTIVSLAIFGEASPLSKSKYEYILERFKGIFALLAQSPACEKIFCEVRKYEPKWDKFKRKLVATSFDQKRLSIFTQKGKLMGEDIAFSLKYVIISYNYKILKIITQRVRISYDEHILSVFHNLVLKNRTALGNLMAQKDKQNSFDILLLINENIYIIKSYILNLILLSENLDSMQRQAKFETIKDICIDSLNAAIKFSSNNTQLTPKNAANLTINKPKDLLGFIFKSLLMFKKCISARNNIKHEKEFETKLNTLITDLMSRPIPTDDPICFQLYKLYLLQYIKEWDVKFLKEKHVKYTEEMSRYLSGFEEENAVQDDVLAILNQRVTQNALEIFVVMASIDCEPAIEISVALIRDCFTSEQKLSKYFRIITCILTQKVLSEESFKGLLTWEKDYANSMFRTLEKSLQMTMFFQKDGMRTLFSNYHSTIISYKQTKDQTKLYSQGKISHHHSPSIETDTFALGEHLKKLWNTVDCYKKLLDVTASFICSLHNIRYFTEHLLMNSDWTNIFTEILLTTKKGHRLMHELISVLHKNASDNESLLTKYVALIVELLRRVHTISPNIKLNRFTIVKFIQLLISIIDSEDQFVQKRRGIIFEKAVIPLIVDLCHRSEYSQDVEVFTLFLKLVKFISRGNSLLEENKDSKIEINDLVISRYKSILAKEPEYLSTTKVILDELIEIAVDSNFNIDQPKPVIIKDTMALETYYDIINLCLKNSSYEAEKVISRYIISPLSVLSQSLINLSLIARTTLPCRLLRILKRTVDETLAQQISNYIGTINSVHSTPKQIKHVLNYFINPPLEMSQANISAFCQILLDTLLNIISGENIKEFFYFDGHKNSFIFLKPTLAFPSNGICWTGYIRFEHKGLSRSQCIFSFIKKDGKGYEMLVRNRKLVYRIVNASRAVTVHEVVFDESAVKEDVWHHITMHHMQKELIVYLDDAVWTKELTESCSFSKTYSIVTLGARFDLESNKAKDYFIGEMSALCFFTPSQKVKEILKQIRFDDNFLPYIHHQESEMGTYFFELALWKDSKIFQQELFPTNHLIVDPRHFLFSPNGKEPIYVKSLQEVSLYVNCPGKEVFSNLGGLKTAIPLIMDRALRKSELEESELNICVGLLRLIHCLCLNNNVQAVRFLTQERGINLLRFSFEKIGKSNKFNKLFVDSLFNILIMPIHYDTWKSYRLVPLLIENIAFNMNVWISSEFSVQVHLLEIINDFMSQQTGIQFSTNEPFKSILFMMFDYLTPEESEIYDIKDFLKEIHIQLQCMLMNQLLMRGKADNVKVIAKYLLPDPDKFSQIRDLLKVIVQYQYVMAKEHKSSIFSEYVLNEEPDNFNDSIGFVTTLFLIIHTAVSHRLQLNAILEETDVQVNSKLECMEDLIASSVDILLSLSWYKINEKVTESKGPDNRILKLMKPHIRVKSTEEIIMTYLLKRQSYSRGGLSSYEKCYLGPLVYKSMLKRIFKQPLTISKFNAELEGNISEIDDSSLNIRYVETFYKTVMQNIIAFQVDVQTEIFKDIKRFLTNPDIYAVILSSEIIAQSMIICLTKKKYYANITLRPSIEEFIVLFIIYNWSKKSMKKCITDTFILMQKLDVNIFISISKELIKRLTISSDPLYNTYGMFLLIQFIYSLEDVAIQNPIYLIDSQFAELVSILLFLLEKVEMFYFWIPSFGMQSFAPDLKTEYDSRCTQREGGIVRIILRLLFAMIVKVDDKESNSIIQMIEFFVFHNKQITKEKTKMVNCSTIVEEKKGDESSNFIRHSIFNNPKQCALVKLRIKAISQEKSIVQQKPVEALFDGSKDVYESPAYKVLLLVTYIEQCIIYISFGVTSYKEISQVDLEAEKQAENPISEKVKLLVILLGRILFESECIDMISQEIEKRYNRLGKFSIKSCYSDIDMLPHELSPAINGDHIPLIGKSRANHADFTFGAAIATESIVNPNESKKALAFKEDLMKLLKEMHGKYKSCIEKKIDIDQYVKHSLTCLLGLNTIKMIQAGLHDAITEEYTSIDKAIFFYLSKRTLAFEKANSISEKSPMKGKARFDELKNLIIIASKTAHVICQNIPEEKSSTKMEEEYNKLRATVISNKPFCRRDKESEKIYDIVKRHYNKLIARCPLYKQFASKQIYSGINQFKTFVKLDLSKDPLGRAMRLKPMKNPLKNPSIIKGISYMRQFFLKRVMIAYITHENEPEDAQKLLYQRFFLINDQYTEQMLLGLLGRGAKKLRPGAMYKHNSNPRLVKSNMMLTLPSEKKVDIDLVSSQAMLRRSVMFMTEREKEIKEAEGIEGEIIKMDTSIFGIFYVLRKSIVFESRTKAADKIKYRLGCSKEMSWEPAAKVRKKWKFEDINTIIMRRHNLIKQAVELSLKNNKLVFLIFFSEANMKVFFSIVKSKLEERKEFASILIVDDTKTETSISKHKENWKKKALTTFEYLMKLNFYSGRTFQNLSQYPVFPWIIQNFTDKVLSFTKPIYRDLHYPMAAINERKRQEGIKKYENTEDFSGGPFQFGAHYMPGRAVLGYLMRLQPYTQMIYRFDCGGDCPSRHFHVLEKTWSNLQKETDINLELIPEFFYNAEFFANHNCLSFGMKQMVENSEDFDGQIVRVNTVILPPWAKSNHHFVYMNYMALEQNCIRESIHNWIDLIFGYKQQKGGENFNLFKPLTSEKYVKQREASQDNKLDIAEVSHIAEFGQHPIQIFDRPHDQFDARVHEISQSIYDAIFNESSVNIANALFTRKALPFNYSLRKAISRPLLEVNKNNSKTKTIGKPIELPSIYPLIESKKSSFTHNPTCVFVSGEEYLIVGRTIDHAFTVYSLSNFTKLATIIFHQNIVTSLKMFDKRKMLFTGDMDGVVAVWKLEDGITKNKTPASFYNDHGRAIVSLDANHELDLFISSSSKKCVLRVISTNRHFLTFKPTLNIHKVLYTIYNTMLSARGYIVFHLRSTLKTYERDIISVYSINGERVAQRLMQEYINAIVFDDSQYFIIVGGITRKLTSYEIVTMEEKKCNEFGVGHTEFPAPITSLTLMNDGKTLFVGLANNTLGILQCI